MLFLILILLGFIPAIPARAVPVDPNDAPLPLISRIDRLDREGAVRIGEARREMRFRSDREMADLLGLPEEDLAGRFRFRGGEPSMAGFRMRIERGRGGERQTRSIETAHGRFRFGVTAERDGGERTWNDFLAWSLSYEPAGKRTRIVAGDLAVRFGSGLVVGTSGPIGSPTGFGVREKSRLSRYRSRMESRAHRGFGVSRVAGAGRLFLLLTSTLRDARTDESGRVSSYDDSGLHRTGSEIARKDRSAERIAAIRWERSAGPVGGGITIAAARFDPPLGGGDLSKKPTAFLGDRLAASSIDLVCRRGRLLAAGECAISSSGGAAGWGMASLSSGRKRAALRVRHFESRFHTPRSGVYHRLGSKPAGETGWIFHLRSPLALSVTGAARIHRYASHGRPYRSAGRVFGGGWAVGLEGDAGPAALHIRTGGEEKSEVIGGRRDTGRSLSLAAAATIRAGRWRGRWDGKFSAARSAGSGRVRRGKAVSFLLTRRGPSGRSLSLSVTALFETDRALAFPAPRLPGALPFDWFGGGRGRGGVRVGWSGPLAGPVHAALLAGPGSAAVEFAFAAAGRIEPPPVDRISWE